MAASSTVYLSETRRFTFSYRLSARLCLLYKPKRKRAGRGDARSRWDTSLKLNSWLNYAIDYIIDRMNARVAAG